MSLRTSSKLGFIVINFLVSTSSAQLLSGKPGKIRPGIVPTERRGPENETKEKSQIEITSINGKSIYILPNNLIL